MDPIESYIRTAAQMRGIDPDIAMRVARSEGFNSYTGDNGSSFGPFQLHYGGVAPGGNRVSGLGDDFTRQTGLDARDPSTVNNQIDFALDHAAQNGWGAWHGWKGDPYAGIGNNASPVASAYANAGDPVAGSAPISAINAALAQGGAPQNNAPPINPITGALAASAAPAPNQNPANDPLVPQSTPMGPTASADAAAAAGLSDKTQDRLPLTAPVAAAGPTPAAPASPAQLPLWAQQAQVANNPSPPPANPTPLQYAQRAISDADKAPPQPQQQFRNPNDVSNALQGIGAWLIAANNPSGGASLLNASLARQKLMMPEFGQIGTDSFNKAIYGYHDPYGNVTPVTLPGSNGNDNGLGFTPYEQLNKGDQNMVDAMLDGREPLPGQRQLTNQYWVNLIKAANQRSLDQGGAGFDPTSWKQRLDTQTAYDPNGKVGTQLAALDTLDTHIEKNSNAAEKLNQGPWAPLNNAYNTLTMNTPVDPAHRDALNEYNNSQKALMDELGKAWKTGVLSDQEVNDWRARLSSGGSLQDMRRNLHDFMELVDGRRQTLMHNYGAIMGGQTPKNYNGAEHERIEGIVNSRFSGTAPQQQGAAPAQGAAPNKAPTQTRQIGGKTYYQGPNGKWFDNPNLE